jgi:hypothetical protein
MHAIDKTLSLIRLNSLIWDIMSTNQQVSGALGEYMEGPTHRCHCQWLFGNIVIAIGEKKSLV